MPRDSLRLLLGKVLGRVAGGLSRGLGRGGGTTLPGKLLLAFEGEAIRELGRRLPAGAVAISATNGKTTTASMLAEILEPHLGLAHNRAGANLASGVATALLGAREAELGVFEADEAALREIARQLRPRVLLLGNLFRDQLDRYGELELIAEQWHATVAELPPESVVAVNADDPLLAGLARSRARAISFGIDDEAVARGTLPHASDSKYCPACDEPLGYAQIYVGHLGCWACTPCGDARPQLDVAARRVCVHGLESVSFELVERRVHEQVALSVAGLYNVYNALAAAAAARALEVPLSDVAAGLERFRPAFGRLQRVVAADRTILLLLIKNPAGANEVIRTLIGAGERPAVMLALNDEIADGRDVSWIWDVDFEPLMPLADRIVVSGTRAEELALRLKYGGYDEARLEVHADLAAALDRGLALCEPGSELPLLPTYTAMLELQRILADRGLAEQYWR